MRRVEVRPGRQCSVHFTSHLAEVSDAHFAKKVPRSSHKKPNILLHEKVWIMVATVSSLQTCEMLLRKTQHMAIDGRRPELGGSWQNYLPVLNTHRIFTGCTSWTKTTVLLGARRLGAQGHLFNTKCISKTKLGKNPLVGQNGLGSLM